MKVKEIEEISDKENLVDQIVEISQKKVMAIAEENKDSYVVGADTLVEVDEEVLGKPSSEDEAREMLRKLSGKKHRVITAYTLANLENNILKSDYSESFVYFKKLSAEEIEWYVESKEPLDKAGAYGIQGLGSVFVEKIEGDFFSIMGFPINKFIKTLEEIGVEIKDIKKI